LTSSGATLVYINLYLGQNKCDCKLAWVGFGKTK